MVRKIPLCLLVGLIVSLAASAGEVETGAAQGVYVDVTKVVAAEAVSPVDGIRSAGQPDAAAFKVFADAGYVAVIDMRGPKEDRGLSDERALIEELGMDYVALPITDRKQINVETAAELDRLLAGFDGPVLIHCRSANRAGAVLALRHSLTGVSDDEALAFGATAGLTKPQLKALVQERLGKN